MKKTDVILDILYTLLTTKKLKKGDIISKYQISSITFARYIADVRGFFAENAPKYVVIYNKDKRYYALKEEK